MKTKAFIVGTLFLVALNFGFSGCSRVETVCLVRFLPFMRKSWSAF